jgi:dienelactone hydrolase
MTNHRVVSLCVVALFAAGAALAQTNRVDVVTPSAPELAPYGMHAIGVRTIQVTDKNRPDILSTKEGAPTARYDRTLTVEVWYPAALASGQQPGGDYRTITRDPAIATTLHGKAVRDAAPLPTGGPFPLVVVSHGYPGNRFLMSHLTENLASKGFVVASIDHKDSTYDDQKAFGSTLYNRPFDQLFVLREMDRLGMRGSGSFLAGVVDASRTGIVGYSMGGYGVVNVLGGGYSKASETLNGAPPNRLLAERGAANPEYQKSRDARIKAAIAIAPWGMPAGFWDAEGLKGIKTPVLFVAGSVDDVADTRRERRRSTTPRSTPNATCSRSSTPTTTPARRFRRRQKPMSRRRRGGRRRSPTTPTGVWDTVRMNNILDHFATAFFALHLKGEADKQAYLDPGWKGSGAARQPA